MVEDEVLVHLELVEMIEDAGFLVYEVGNADEAIRILNAHPEIHLLMTDIDMPGSMNGLKLSRYVRDRWPPIKIVVASSHVKVKPEDLPSHGVFFGKPYDTPRVQALLTEIAGQIHN